MSRDRANFGFVSSLAGAALALALVACSDRASGPEDAGRDAGGRDAGVRTDSGVRADAGPGDAGAGDSGPGDAGPGDAGPGYDAGPSPIVVDGVMRAGEWDDATCVTNAVASGWTGANSLMRMCATVRGPDLVLAVEGLVEPTNAIVVYVDRELGDAYGIADLSTLTDSSGDLDDALSAGIVTPAEFHADWAWGTRDMARTAVDFDARMGWRDIATDVTDFAWVSAADAPTSCGTTVCETRIALTRIGGVSPSMIGLFARIVNADGSMSPNQCLPEDDAAMPRVVHTLLRVAR